MTESESEDLAHRPAIEHRRRGRQGGLIPQRRYRARWRRGRDSYAALIATMIGLLALLVSAYTAYVQREQLRAQVWPYVVIGTANVSPFVGIHAINSGTGPGRVIAVGVQVDERFVTNWTHAAQIAGDESIVTIQSRLGNTVLSAGKDLTFFQPYGQDASARFVELFLNGKHRVQVTICYCSVLDDCWVTSSRSVPVLLDDADACPIPNTARFQE